ncbi:hypothetical protein [Breoghania sp. L-A4]|uniref:hypothetical protein n=1 Tax=Breoghania sp. L-A4 TaxID=2304600 RepID=UPI000E35E250|nr:hypothetical protein [Breoghania sp. L-A4]AXS40903.1 hypothetical protein D1F64_13745 [Breoghania sp. L-A4]
MRVLYTTARAVKAACAVAFLVGSAAPAQAFSPAPHEMPFHTLSDIELRLEMDPDSQAIGTVRRGTGDIRVLWCEPAIPSQAWQDATPDQQRALLDTRWCEIEADGLVGNVDGRMLSPG